MDAELKDKPGRKKTGLVDRIYADQLGESESPDPYADPVYRKYVLEREIKDPYAQEVGPGAGMMKGIESWLGENVAEPLGRAGWPKVGAAAAAIPATVADLAIPQTAGDYAGALIPIGKFGKAAKALSAEEKLALKTAPKAEVTPISKAAQFNDLDEVRAAGVRTKADKILDKRGIDEPDYVRTARNPKTVVENDARKNAVSEEDLARPLTKEEMAAKRAENNRNILASEGKSKRSADPYSKTNKLKADLDSQETDAIVAAETAKRGPKEIERVTNLVKGNPEQAVEQHALAHRNLRDFWADMRDKYGSNWDAKKDLTPGEKATVDHLSKKRAALMKHVPEDRMDESLDRAESMRNVSQIPMKRAVGDIPKPKELNPSFDKFLHDHQESDHFDELLRNGNPSAQEEGNFGVTHRDMIDSWKDYLGSISHEMSPETVKEFEKEIKDTEKFHIKNKSIDEEM